jgi:hypothetical protein
LRRNTFQPSFAVATSFRSIWNEPPTIDDDDVSQYPSHAEADGLALGDRLSDPSGDSDADGLSEAEGVGDAAGVSDDTGVSSGDPSSVSSTVSLSEAAGDSAGEALSVASIHQAGREMLNTADSVSVSEGVSVRAHEAAKLSASRTVPFANVLLSRLASTPPAQIVLKSPVAE